MYFFVPRTSRSPAVKTSGRSRAELTPIRPVSNGDLPRVLAQYGSRWMLSRQSGQLDSPLQIGTRNPGTVVRDVHFGEYSGSKSSVYSLASLVLSPTRSASTVGVSSPSSSCSRRPRPTSSSIQISSRKVYEAFDWLRSLCSVIRSIAVLDNLMVEKVLPVAEDPGERRRLICHSLRSRLPVSLAHASAPHRSPGTSPGGRRRSR